MLNFKKYKLQKDIGGLYRLIAVKNFSDIKAGDHGGRVFSESNLCHEGDCWVYIDAVVKDKAHVGGNAKIADRAIVKGNATVRGYSRISDAAVIDGRAVVVGASRVYGSAHITGDTILMGDGDYCGKTKITGRKTINANTPFNRIYNGVTKLGYY